MGALNQETQNIQNPALGAMLLWRFAVGYAEGNKVSDPTPLPLLFVVLPMMMHEETARLIVSTHKSSGLRAFAGKFSDSRVAKNDLLLAIHDRAIRMRRLTMESLRLALASKLLSVDFKRGAAVSLSSTTPMLGIPKSVQSMIKNVEKLGYWCSEVSLYEVSNALKVGF